MIAYSDLTATVLGGWLILGPDPKVMEERHCWRCQCRACGRVQVRSDRAVRRSVLGCHSCIMMQHGRAARTHAPRNRTYGTWRSMLRRCETPHDPSYDRYGAMGVAVCERWHDYDAFLADMGPKPDGTVIDRIDNDRGYSPDNCRWATHKESSRNRRSTKLNHQATAVIRWARRAGKNISLVSRLYGINRPHAQRILDGKAWS